LVAGGDQVRGFAGRDHVHVRLDLLQGHRGGDVAQQRPALRRRLGIVVFGRRRLAVPDRLIDRAHLRRARPFVQRGDTAAAAGEPGETAGGPRAQRLLGEEGVEHRLQLPRERGIALDQRGFERLAIRAEMLHQHGEIAGPVLGRHETGEGLGGILPDGLALGGRKLRPFGLVIVLSATGKQRGGNPEAHNR
jgi:hypothetical protein